MARRPPIMIAGHYLREASFDEIFAEAFRQGHRVFDLGRTGDYRRNCDLLAIFGDDEVLDAETSVERFRKIKDSEFSEQFDIFRTAELLRWSQDERLVERIDDVLPHVRKWRLLHRTRAFELFERASGKRWSVRVRHIDDPIEAATAAKSWKKEQRRAARLKAKRIAEKKKTAMRYLDEILKLDADRPLPEKLTSFAVADLSTFAACQELIRAAFDSDADLARVTEITWVLGIESHLCFIEKCERDRAAMRAGEAELAGLIL